MNLAEVTGWLKTSIPGIILLGALGSILAVAIAKLLGPPLRSLAFRPLIILRKERMWRYWRSAAAYSHIEKDATNRKLIYYLFRHLARLAIALAGFVATTAIFSIIVYSRSAALLTYGTFILSSAAFLFAYWVRVEYEYITINYIIEWRHTGLVENPFPNDPALRGSDQSPARSDAQQHAPFDAASPRN